MKFDFKIHGLNGGIKAVLGNIEFAFTRTQFKKNELLVINYHGTQKKYIYNFEKQIKFFLKYFEIIEPGLLNEFYQGNLKDSNKPFLLLTFDDGILNNLHAVEVLNKYKLKAYFFIVPLFVNSPPDKQKTFFTKNIRTNYNEFINNELEDFLPLDWLSINRLSNQGHQIGAHTMSHRLVSAHSSYENSVYEILECKVEIERNLTKSQKIVDGFCSIVNSLESAGSKEFELIRSKYNFHFTTLPGKNYPNSNKLFIRRVNIEAHWLFGSIKFAIGRINIFLWKERIEQYSKLINEKY
jgi:peptidoglycan/xylan/chitin deacetylase (PgdA/CDA1 family)